MALGRWLALLAGCAGDPTASALPGDAMPPPPSTSHTWPWTDLGEGIGASGIHPLATTHGPRLVATTQEGGSWSVFRDDGGQGLTAVHSGRYDDQRSIAALTVGNVRPSSGDEIVVAYDDGVVDIFSGEDFELVDTMTLYETDISQLLACSLALRTCRRRAPSRERAHIRTSTSSFACALRWAGACASRLPQDPRDDRGAGGRDIDTWFANAAFMPRAWKR